MKSKILTTIGSIILFWLWVWFGLTVWSVYSELFVVLSLFGIGYGCLLLGISFRE